MSNIINYGISETLKALFAQLKETPSQNGYKYHARDVDRISQDIVCRNYGSVCYELSFLCWAVVNNPQYPSSPLLNFFWLEENVQPKRFRTVFSQPIQSGSGQVWMGTDYLQLQFGDFEFAISPTRIGVLAVMLEFIASIEPMQLTKIEKQLLDADALTVKQLSSKLQKLIYGYLKEHIPEASTQERFRAISDWLRKHGLTANTLTDQDVLDFWLNPPEQPSYIKYSTVLDDLLDAINAIDVVENSVSAEYALSLGSDAEHGEVNADWIQNNVFEQIENNSDLSWLCHSPKFLTMGQYQPIKPLLTHGKLARQLPLSFLRLEIFGGWQAVLVQAKRKSQQVLADKLGQLPERNYQSYIDKLEGVEFQCRQVQRVIAHIFYSLDSPLFIGIILNQIGLELQQKLKSWINEHIDVLEEYDANNIAHIQQWISQNPDAQTWLAESGNAFKFNNKDGFKNLPSLEQLDVYQRGSEALDHCQTIINQYSSALCKFKLENNALSEIYRSDLCIFNSRFKQIYGTPHD